LSIFIPYPTLKSIMSSSSTNGGSNGNGSTSTTTPAPRVGTDRVKQGLAQMLKGGVIVRILFLACFVGFVIACLIDWMLLAIQSFIGVISSRGLTQRRRMQRTTTTAGKASNPSHPASVLPSSSGGYPSTCLYLDAYISNFTT
jgi:hypothetical protein